MGVYHLCVWLILWPLASYVHCYCAIIRLISILKHYKGELVDKNSNIELRKLLCFKYEALFAVRAIHGYTVWGSRQVWCGAALVDLAMSDMGTGV